jgi:hypothetical protein
MSSSSHRRKCSNLNAITGTTIASNRISRAGARIGVVSSIKDTNNLSDLSKGTVSRVTEVEEVDTSVMNNRSISEDLQSTMGVMASLSEAIRIQLMEVIEVRVIHSHSMAIPTNHSTNLFNNRQVDQRME